MGKLHEVLAVEGEVKTAATAILAETLTTLSKKHDHFNGQTRKYAPSTDGGETFPDENKEMVTTVKEKQTGGILEDSSADIKQLKNGSFVALRHWLKDSLVELP